MTYVPAMNGSAYGLVSAMAENPWAALCLFVGSDDGIMRDLRDLDVVVDFGARDGLRVGSMKYADEVLSIPFGTMRELEGRSNAEAGRELRRLVRAGLDEYLSPLLIMRRAQVGE